MLSPLSLEWTFWIIKSESQGRHPRLDNKLWFAQTYSLTLSDVIPRENPKVGKATTRGWPFKVLRVLSEREIEPCPHSPCAARSTASGRSKLTWEITKGMVHTHSLEQMKKIQLECRGTRQFTREVKGLSWRSKITGAHILTFFDEIEPVRRSQKCRTSTIVWNEKAILEEFFGSFYFDTSIKTVLKVPYEFLMKSLLVPCVATCS